VPLARSVRPAIVAGALSGVASGIAIGAMTGPLGIVVGVVLGLGIGAIAGRVIEKEDCRRDHRTRELDEVIGTTTGDMSAGPVHHHRRSVHDLESRAEMDRWVNEWLTPPPPAVT
jgi:hypothetical protein